VGGHGFGNGQLEYNTARHENSYVENGKLVIEARREDYMGNAFTSARMLTQGRFAFKYGTLEARIKVPDTGNGIWPAFWMLGNNFPAIEWPRSGEIDILEVGGKVGIANGLQRRRINCALHYGGADGKYAMADAWHDADVDLNLDYHTYKLSWTPEHVRFYLDDVDFGSWDITADHFSEFHQPCFLILNVAVGGWPTSYTGVSSPGKVTAPLPAKMYVDWIRLTKNEHTQVCFGKDMEETGSFGVFTETTPVKTSLTYEEGTNHQFEDNASAAVYTWNNMTPTKTPPSPSEGNQCWAYDIAKGDWFGMGVFLPHFRNMANYSDGFLHFDVKTNSPVPMKVGIKSSRGGECFLPLGDETAEFGFKRNGQWHRVTIPLNRFGNIDFLTVHQMFMISGDAPASAVKLAIDNVWWQPSVPRPTPKGGTFGVFTETESHRASGTFAIGKEGDFFVWEKTLVDAEEKPREGNRSKSLQSAPGVNWFGAAFTPNIKHDLRAFRYPNSRLRFSLKTSSSATFMIGMKSGNVDGIGQKWITFSPGTDPYGFIRDGQWHVIEIPMSHIAQEVDLRQVSQLFQVLGLTGPISNLELDDIYFTAGGPHDTDE